MLYVKSLVPLKNKTRKKTLAFFEKNLDSFFFRFWHGDSIFLLINKCKILAGISIPFNAM